MQYEKIVYPDGQITVKRTEVLMPDFVHINERINSYEDLFLIKTIASVFTKSRVVLNIPCLFGQRSDRRFNSNQSFDLKIIAEFINSCNFYEVNIFDPHSDVSLALINNSNKLSSLSYVQKAISDLYEPKTGINNCNFTLVSPDAGAYKKVFEYGQRCNLPVLAAVKYRDLEGNVSLKFMGDVKDKHCLIVDDLCDGGYTFVQLGKQLKEQGAQKVYLYVSHGYFSKGFEELETVIDHIYCTNSVKDIKGIEYTRKQGTIHIDDYLTQFKII